VRFRIAQPSFVVLGLMLTPSLPQSGLLAACINISQFVIIKEAGAVSSTVVGHLKTCSIILLGWITSGNSLKDMSIVGFVLAISGIIL
jgi:solute carrier family 35 protein E3